MHIIVQIGQARCSIVHQSCLCWGNKYNKIGDVFFGFVAYETTPARPHLPLLACLFLLMSFLGMAMYCTERQHPQRLCEELEASLAVYLLNMKQLLWGCWIWLTMQWLTPTTGGDIEHYLISSNNSFNILGSVQSGPTNTPQSFW